MHIKKIITLQTQPYYYIIIITQTRLASILKSRYRPVYYAVEGRYVVTVDNYEIISQYGIQYFTHDIRLFNLLFQSEYLVTPITPIISYYNVILCSYTIVCVLIGERIPEGNV